MQRTLNLYVIDTITNIIKQIEERPSDYLGVN